MTTRQRKPVSSNKLDYFKDNIQDPTEDDDFDPSQYYYKRTDAPPSMRQDQQQSIMSLLNNAAANNTSNPIMPSTSMEPSSLDEQDSDDLGAAFPMTHGSSFGGAIGQPRASPAFQNQGMMQRFAVSTASAPSVLQQNAFGFGNTNGPTSNSMYSTMHSNPAPSSTAVRQPTLSQMVSSNPRSMITIQTATPPPTSTPNTLTSPVRPSSTTSSAQAMPPSSPLRPPSAPPSMGSTLLQGTSQMPAPLEYKPSNSILAMIQKSATPQPTPMSSQMPYPQQAPQARMNLEGLLPYMRSSTPNDRTVNQIASDILSLSGSSTPVLPSSDTPPPPTIKRPPSDEKFSLLGLLNVIKMTDPDLNVLALGFDLTTLGLNLNSSEYLYTSFASPWSDGPPRIVPDFKLPTCYQLQQPVPLKNSHFQKFQDETLFYIFYSMPRDVLQLVAAKELTERKWRYHRDLKLWFKKEGLPNPSDIVTTSNGTIERGPFFYFDVNTWSKKVTKQEFTLDQSRLGFTA